MFTLVTLASCGSSTEESSRSAVGGQAAAPEEAATLERASPIGAQAQTDTPAPRRLIHNVSLDLTIEDTDRLAEEAEELSTTNGGYVEALNATQGEHGTSYQMTLRIPGDQLDPVVDGLKALASEVRSETRSTEDVTGRFVDLEARRRALALTEQQLEELLAESRSERRDAEGIMTIFRELSSIRQQRESIDGQLASLEDLVSFSRLYLTIAPIDSGAEVGIEWAFGRNIRDAVQRLLGLLAGLSYLAINIVIVIVPVLGIFVLVAFAVVRLRKRTRKLE